MLIARAVTVKSRVTPNLRTQLVAETQRALRDAESELEKAVADPARRAAQEKRDGCVRRLKELARLQHGEEIVRGQVQGFYDVRVGDVWPLALSCEIVVEDGRVVAIREGTTVSVGVEGGPDAEPRGPGQ